MTGSYKPDHRNQLVYGTRYYMVPAGIWYQLVYGTGWYMVPAGIWYQLVYGTSWYMVPAGIWYRLACGTGWYMVPAGIWYQLVYGTSWYMVYVNKPKSDLSTFGCQSSPNTATRGHPINNSTYVTVVKSTRFVVLCKQKRAVPTVCHLVNDKRAH